MPDGPSAVEVRRVGADDWRIWRALRLAALRDAPEAFGSRLEDWIDAPEERWRERLALPGAHDLIAVVRSQPAGMMSVVPTPDPACVLLISVWVAPAARGTGVASDLLDAAIRAAAATGASVLDLSVMPDNPSARRLYERAGFAVLDEPGAALPDGRCQLRMRRHLP